MPSRRRRYATVRWRTDTKGAVKSYWDYVIERSSPGVPERSTVLVVDDEPSICEIVVQVLRDEGYRAAAAPDGATALALIERRGRSGLQMQSNQGQHDQGRGNQPAIGLILLDLQMPGMDGWQFANCYRQTPGPHAPIVVFAAQRDVEAAATADWIGATGFLTKPFELDALLEVVARVLPAPVPEPRCWR